MSLQKQKFLFVFSLNFLFCFVDIRDTRMSWDPTGDHIFTGVIMVFNIHLDRLGKLKFKKIPFLQTVKLRCHPDCTFREL